MLSPDRQTCAIIRRVVPDNTYSCATKVSLQTPIAIRDPSVPFHSPPTILTCSSSWNGAFICSSRIHLFKLANKPLFLGSDMSSSEDHEDCDDPPPSRPIPLTGSELDDDMDADMDDYRSSQILEIDYINVPTLRKLEMRRDEYQSFPEESKVKRCVREVTREGGLWYKTVFADGHMDLVSCYKLHDEG